MIITCPFHYLTPYRRNTAHLFFFPGREIILSVECRCWHRQRLVVIKYGIRNISLRFDWVFNRKGRMTEQRSLAWNPNRKRCWFHAWGWFPFVHASSNCRTVNVYLMWYPFVADALEISLLSVLQNLYTQWVLFMFVCCCWCCWGIWELFYLNFSLPLFSHLLLLELPLLFCCCCFF